MDAHQLEDIAKIARASGADAVEALFVSSTDVTAGVRMGKQEVLERSESQAIGLRVWVGKRQAMVSSDDLDTANLRGLIETATNMAKASPIDPHAGLAPRESWAATLPDLDIKDTCEPTISQLEALCHTAEEAALAVKGVTNSDGARASYGYQKRALLIAPSEGAPFFGSYDSTHYGLSVTALAGEGTAMEEDYDYSSKRFMADLADAAGMGRNAGERAVRRLSPVSMPTCQLPILWEKRVGKSLLGNFLGAINGGSVARGSSFLKDKMGEQIFAKDVQIIDDPHMKRGLASKPFDGEGMANGKLDLVENGVLNHWLLSMRSANQLGLKSNARASRGLGSPPSASSTNTYMQAGSSSAADMLAGIEKGLYVTDVFGMGVNGVTGDYSQGAGGFLIENGELTKPISEITIAGNLLDMFKNLTPADDLTFEYSTNVPTLRIDGMTVAGA